jgi:hypothetical protein
MIDEILFLVKFSSTPTNFSVPQNLRARFQLLHIK